MASPREPDIPPAWDSFDDMIRETLDEFPDLDTPDDAIEYRIWNSNHYEERHENVR